MARRRTVNSEIAGSNPALSVFSNDFFGYGVFLLAALLGFAAAVVSWVRG